MATNNPMGLSFFIKQQASYSRVQAFFRMLLGQVYILIPHLVVLFVFSIWGGILNILAWWSILFTEKYPKTWYEYQVALHRWQMRVLARMWHLRDGYPAFGLNGKDENIIYEVAYPEKLSRGKLLLKTFFGFLLLLPHAFCLLFRWIASAFLAILTAISIIFTGNYPASWHRFNVGTLRWASRIALYPLMNDEYPPFYGKTNKNELDNTEVAGATEIVAAVAATAPITKSAEASAPKTVLVRQPDGTIVKKVVDESSTSKTQTPEKTTSMKTAETPSPKEETKKSSKSWIALLLLALFLFAGTVFLFFKYYNLDKSYTTLLSEKLANEERYEITLDSLQTLIENLNSEALMLRDQIEHPEKNAKYQGLMDEYNSLKSRLGQLQAGGDSPKLKKEIADLKLRIQQLEQEIIAFKAQIGGLELEKTQLSSDVSAEKKRADDFKNESTRLQGQIDEAAKLDFEDIISGGIKYKSEEKKKDKPKAKSLNKIQVCFSIAANKIAKPGNREIYVRIVNPNGEVLKRGDQKVTIAGESLDYSISKSQSYSNKEELVCMYYDKNDDKLLKGAYSVEIYAEDRKVGESAFILK